MNPQSQAAGLSKHQNVLLEWTKAGGIVGHCLKVFALSVITLNIYYFWGKAETRKRVWNAIHLQGQPLSYTGTGGELFLGALIVSALMILVFFAFIGITTGKLGYFIPTAIFIPILRFFPNIIVLGFLFLLGIAYYRSRRYRLSRTTWRGIRGSMEGSSVIFGLHVIWTTFVTLITAGLFLPWQLNFLQGQIINNTRYGATPLVYKGKPWPLYKFYGPVWLIVVPVLLGIGFFGKNLKAYLEDINIFQKTGLSDAGATSFQLHSGQIELITHISAVVAVLCLFLCMVAFLSQFLNHLENSTYFDDARFELKTNPLSLFWLFLSNTLLLIFTLGIAYPAAQARTIRYYIDRLSIQGSISFEKVMQNQAALSATGEGLAEQFDIGFV